MSDRKRLPVLSADQAETLAEVDASDRRRAQSAITDGVRAAQDQWIGAHYIAKALTLELVAIAHTHQSATQVASYLRELAQSIEGQAKNRARMQ